MVCLNSRHFVFKNRMHDSKKLECSNSSQKARILLKKLGEIRKSLSYREKFIQGTNKYVRSTEMFEFLSIAVIGSQLYFSFNFICFEHIQFLPVISWFWFFLHISIWALPIWAPICFPEVTYPRYDPGDVAIHLSLIPLSTSMPPKSVTILHTAEIWLAQSTHHINME